MGQPMSSKLWPPLEEGDIVDLVAPGMASEKSLLLKAEKALQRWGLKARYPKDLYGKDLLCANSREKRFKHLKKALLAKDSKAVWCLRGGYGSFQLLKSLAKIRKGPAKTFIGLSDMTSLHTFLVQKWGWATLHGSHIDRLALGKVTTKELKQLREVLFGEIEQLEYDLKPLNAKARLGLKIQAPVVGGNMITLQASFGTSFQINPKGAVLFFEEIGERAYKIDRVLEHMDQLGLFKSVRAVVFGQFTGGKEPNGKKLIPSLLKDFAQRVSFPVFSGLESGHGVKQVPLPFGVQAELKGGRKPKLTVPTGAKL